MHTNKPCELNNHKLAAKRALTCRGRCRAGAARFAQHSQHKQVHKHSKRARKSHHHSTTPGALAHATLTRFPTCNASRIGGHAKDRGERGGSRHGSAHSPPHPRRPSPTTGLRERSQMPVTMNPTLGPAPAARDPCARYCLTGPRRVLALSTRWQAAQARQLPQPGTQVATPLYQLRHEGAKSFPSPACPSTPRRDLRASNQADGHCKRHQLLRALLKEGVVSDQSNLRAQLQLQQAHHRNKKEGTSSKGRQDKSSLACRTRKSNT